MALDESTAGFLAQMAKLGGKPLYEMDVATAREMSAEMTAMSGQGPEMAETHDATVAATDGGSFELRVLTPRLRR